MAEGTGGQGLLWLLTLYSPVKACEGPSKLVSSPNEVSAGASPGGAASGSAAPRCSGSVVWESSAEASCGVPGLAAASGSEGGSEGGVSAAGLASPWSERDRSDGRGGGASLVPS